MSKQMDDGGPAFPNHSVGINESGEGVLITTGGMTLRDWFAGMALQGLVVNDSYRKLGGGKQAVNAVVMLAFEYADEMILGKESISHDETNTPT